MQTEKQASIDELSSTIAHEIRNPIAAAKSLVQQMGEDPTSVENVEYAKVALDELDRVERRISHLLRYAKEEDYQFEHVNLAAVVDSALTQLRAKLDAAKVNVARNYIGGPTILADGEKLRQVFANMLDNAIDALEPRRPRGGASTCSSRTAAAAPSCACATTAAASRPRRSTASSTRSSPPRRRAPASAWRSRKKIVEAHEGTIDVVSEPGRGTEFAVTLPLPPVSGVTSER